MDDADLLAMAQLYARVFDGPDGQRVLADLRDRFGDRQSFVIGDPHATSYHEGQRAVVLLIDQQRAYAQHPQRYRLTVVGGPDDPEAA